jgi:MerR family transcriptional regulator/heat shock protein HspR
MVHNKLKKRPAYFSISAVAKMFSVHQQTIRLYEKEGFITPQRSDGNTRMFSEEDVEKLEEIIHLTHQLGINLAGVEMVLKLQRKIKRMQKDMNKIFTTAQSELTQETDARKSIIQTQTTQLMKIKKTVDIPSSDNHNHHDDTNSNQSKNNDWDIDYEE